MVYLFCVHAIVKVLVMLITLNNQTLASVVSMDVIAKSILPMLDKLVLDEIPNIRFNVAKTFAKLIEVLRRLPEQGTVYSLEKAGGNIVPSPRGMELIQQRILPNLEKLQKDDDVDVRYFATTAAAVASAPIPGGEPMNTSP
jgi:serine/threonine-protein phosphatase 2A regulatory subunit A